MDFYGGKDPRDLPSHTLTEAAHHLRLPVSTLRSWVVGSTSGLPALFRPALIRPITFSFWNLVEGEVLGALRRKHDVPMQQVRPALEILKHELGHDRPLITGKFLRDREGQKLFVEAFGQIIQASNHFIHDFNEDMVRSLERIEVTGKDDKASAYYPWMRDPKHHKHQNDPKLVRIDPLVSFGRPVMKGTATPTEVIFERNVAGDSVELLAKDYGLDVAVIRHAIAWEKEHAQTGAA